MSKNGRMMTRPIAVSLATLWLCAFTAHAQDDASPEAEPEVEIEASPEAGKSAGGSGSSKKFVPTEEVSADQEVDFPADI